MQSCRELLVRVKAPLNDQLSLCGSGEPGKSPTNSVRPRVALQMTLSPEGWRLGRPSTHHSAGHGRGQPLSSSTKAGHPPSALPSLKAVKYHDHRLGAPMYRALASEPTSPLSEGSLKVSLNHPVSDRYVTPRVPQRGGVA